MYRKQTHRYTYYDKKSEGHIISYDADVCYCGIKKETIKAKAKEAEYKVSTVTRFKEEQPLCARCQNVLKGMLKKEYGIDGW